MANDGNKENPQNIDDAQSEKQRNDENNAKNIQNIKLPIKKRYFPNDSFIIFYPLTLQNYFWEQHLLFS